MNFSDCKILDLPQRSPEWFAVRRGNLTASNFGPWLLNSTKAAQSARESAICKLIAGFAEAWEPPNFENAAMQRGTELEPVAVAAFEKWSGKKVNEAGFCQSIYGRFGCSPDGLIEGENIGFEGKVPIPATHIGYRRAGVLPDEYRFQVHGCMAVTGASGWWFQSWNPDLANLRVYVPRDSFTEELLGALKAFAVEVEEAIKAEAVAWKGEFGG